MYVAQDVANRIKLIAKSKKVAMKTLLTDCELGINSVSKMSSGNDILSKNLAKIADYLDCSVDYLLGRTDVVEINKIPTSPHRMSPKNQAMPQVQKKNMMPFFTRTKHHFGTRCLMGSALRT